MAGLKLLSPMGLFWQVFVSDSVRDLSTPIMLAILAAWRSLVSHQVTLNKCMCFAKQLLLGRK